MSLERVLKNESRYAVLCGDVIGQLRAIPDGCVQCCVTSPPYFGLRDYGCDGQIGLEPDPLAYVEKLVEVFREVRRVLVPSGVAWLNLGDSYAGSAQTGGLGSKEGSAKRAGRMFTRPGAGKVEGRGASRDGSNAVAGCKPKDLCLIPHRVAIALQQDGWWVRCDLPWVKRSSMPDSAVDRPSRALEYVFMLARSERYFFDMESVRKTEGREPDRRLRSSTFKKVQKIGHAQSSAEYVETVGRNFRNSDLWFESVEPPYGLVGVGDELVGLDVTSEAYKQAHFAVFPTRLVRPLILAGTSAKGCCARCFAPWIRVVERDRYETRPGHTNKYEQEGSHRRKDLGREKRVCTETQTVGWKPSCKCNAEIWPCCVLDPFAGSGTTLSVAIENNRRTLGIELNPDYLKLIHRRCENVTPLGLFVE